MNLLSLEYFLVASEELNFTRASKRLYISQQSLSKHIAQLEEYFGLPLFDRNPPMTLTNAGHSLVKRTRVLLQCKKEMESEIRDITDFRRGSVTVGVTHARGTVILPMVLPQFHKLFPQVKLSIVEGTSQQLEEALLSGLVDFTIGFKPHEATNVESVELLNETSILAVPHELMDIYLPELRHELRQVDTCPDIKIFRNFPFITISTSTWAGSMFERYCRKMSFVPKVLVETQNIGTMVALCLEGLGAIVCPRIFLNKQHTLLSEEKIQNISIYSLDHEPEHHIIAINYLKHKYQSQASREFICLTKRLLSRMNNF